MFKRYPTRVITAFVFLCLSTSISRAQGYLTQVGNTPFKTTIPVELGQYDASTGNLHIQIPLGTWPQRGSHSFSAALVYDSRIWLIGHPGGSATWQPTNVPVTNWGGWRLETTPAIGGTTYISNSAINNCNNPDRPMDTYTQYTQMTWVDPYGTVRNFPIYTEYDPHICADGSTDSSAAFANDASGYFMTVTNYVTVSSIVAPDGTTVFPGFEDRNGNWFSLDANSNVIDTLGRTPAKVTTNCNGLSYQICYDVLNSQFNGSTGTSRYTLTTASIYVHTTFGQSGVTEYAGNVTVVSSIILPDNTQYSFTYDSGSTGTFGELTGITLPTSGQINYGYTTFVDAFGNANRWVYTRTSGGGQWTYSPGRLSQCVIGYSYCQKVTVTKPSGDLIEYDFDTNAGNYGSWLTNMIYYKGSWPEIANTATTWSSGPNNIQKLSVTTGLLDAPSPYPIKTVQYTYFSTVQPFVTTISEWNYYPLGSQPSTPDRVTTIPGYCDALPLSVTVTNGGGTQTIAQTNYTYDSYGSNGLIAVPGISHHDDAGFGSSYTSRCNPTSISKLVSGTAYLTTSITYDTTGQVRSVTDQAGNTTNLSYMDTFYLDGSSNPPSTYSPATATNAYLTRVTLPLSGSITYGYYYGMGQKALTTDQNGATSFSHYYDPLGRPTQTISPINGWALWQYPSSSETQVDKFTGIQDTAPSPSCMSCRHDRTSLDGLARTTSALIMSDPDGSTTTATTYDANGRISSVSNPYRSSSDPTYGFETPTYDALDRVTKLTHADSNVANTYFGSAAGSNGGQSSQLCSPSTYGLGYPTLVVDEVGNKREKWVDGFGRTIEIDEPDSSGSPNVNTCYGYNLNNNLASVAPQGSANRTFSYDAISRMTQSIDPETGTTNYYYTTSGGTPCSGDATVTCRRTDARGITTSYSYDTENRLTAISYSDSTPAVSYYYDQTTYNGLSIANGKGRQTGMSDGSGQTASSFDAAGNILVVKKTISGVTSSISYSYNPDNSVASIGYPSGRTITYGYNNASRPVLAVDSANGINYATETRYAPIGTPSTVLHGNTGTFGGITESYVYNNRTQMTSIVASSPNGTALSLGNSYMQSIGNNGDLASVTNNIDTGRNLTLGYDHLNRISAAQTQATSGADCWGLTFGGDSLANLLTESVSKCSAYPLSVSVNSHNQITSTGFGYDLAGNLTTDGTYAYAYNAENQLTSAAGVSYTYDGTGLRTKKSNGTLYWRSVTGDTLAETDLSGNLQSEYVFFAGMRIARRDSSGNVYYYFVDHLGSTRTITDSTGNKCYDTDYYPYGFEAGPFTSTCPQNYKFTGFERDPETGLDYAFRRYYNPRLGRFMSPDPLVGSIKNPQSFNRYTYVLNGPSNLTDGSGLSPQDRHLFITFLLAVLAGRPDAAEIAQATAAQDDFAHATTGLLGLGAIINFSGHFGVPCTQSSQPCVYGPNTGAELHLIEDNSPGATHQIVAGYSLGARIGSELAHIILPLLGKNPDTDSSRLGGWLGVWVYLTGSKDGYPEDLVSQAVTFANQNGLTMVGLQVTLNGGSRALGDQPTSDDHVVYDGVLNGIRLIIYQQPGAGLDYWNNPAIIGSAIWLAYMTSPSNNEGAYDYAVYLCSIGRCDDM